MKLIIQQLEQLIGQRLKLASQLLFQLIASFLQLISLWVLKDVKLLLRREEEAVPLLEK